MTDVVLLVFLDGTLPDDYLEAFPEDAFDVHHAVGDVMARGRVAAGAFDAAVLIGRQSALAFPLLAELAKLPRPVICVTPCGESDEIALLNAGASLCLSPEVRLGDLPFWIRSLLDLVGRHWLPDFDVDPVSRRASYGASELRLRPAEFDLLFHLARQSGRPMNAAELQRRLWPGREPSTQRLAVSMHNLRSALAVVGADVLLQTIPGAGYVLSGERASEARRRIFPRRR
jgi:DNA-binding response OmpR family regulator